MPSPVACSLSAVHRAGPVAGKSLRPECRLSRYSQITGESKTVVPSSSVNAGIFLSGLACARAGFSWTGETIVVISSMFLSSPVSRANTRTLRTNGDAILKKSFIAGSSFVWIQKNSRRLRRLSETPLYGWQHFEPLEASLRVANLEIRHRRERRSAPRPFEHGLHRLRRAGHDRLDAAVSTVAHPTGDA